MDAGCLDGRGRLRYGVRTMIDRVPGRAPLALAISLLLALSLAGAALAGPAEHPVVGRWVVEAEPGGAVWAFQPSGKLVASGPGDVQSEGTWEMIDEDGAFDASLDVVVTGQTLQVLGQVADDGTAVALYILASEASLPEDWTPWPAESRLVGRLFGMMTEETPEPTEPPLDCLRPTWVDGVIDWDRCDEGPTAADQT